MNRSNAKRLSVKKAVSTASPVFIDGEGNPIAGAPPLTACPFCGSIDWICIYTPGTGEPYEGLSHGTCAKCGCEGPCGATPLEAARLWSRPFVRDGILRAITEINILLRTPHIAEQCDISLLGESLKNLQDALEDADWVPPKEAQS